MVIAGLGLVLALVALARARALSRKLDALTQSYWELRYDYTRLRSQVQRLDPETAEAAAAPEPPPPPASVSFVSLSSMKKKDK
jgi:hypothetical protein